MKRALQGVALLAIAIVTIVALHHGVWLPMRCEANVTRSLDAIDDAATRDDVARHAAAKYSDAALRGCECLQRTDVKLAYVRGTIQRYRGESRAAIDSYRRALAIDRRPEIYIDLGLAQLDALDRRSAIESFAIAGSFAPSQLERIPYPDVRAEAERRIRATYGEDWLPISR